MHFWMVSLTYIVECADFWFRIYWSKGSKNGNQILWIPSFDWFITNLILGIGLLWTKPCNVVKPAKVLSRRNKENSRIILILKFVLWDSIDINIRMSAMKPKSFWIHIWWYVPDFLHIMKIRLAPLRFFFCCIQTLQSQDATKNF